MPRFSDEWVIDRVLFDYVSGGSCACCGFQHFLPNGVSDLIGAVSDLETDQVNTEVAALQHHPWPETLRDQVWSDRVKLRQSLKKEMNKYASFWEEHGDEFRNWCLSNGNTVQRLLQLPRSEILEVVRQKYSIHSAYGVVLCTVMEQVANFEKTAYPVDGRGDNEVGFENVLQFGRMSGFTVKLLKADNECDTAVLETWLNRMQSLGGPKLLDRGPKSTSAGADGDNEDDDADGPVVVKGPSFQSDRRVIRLMIARYWSDALMKRYLDETQKEEKEDILESSL